MQYLFGILMFITSLFLILLILVQRGRGGGLAGAFGGMGGQSAFGTKAGDLFTRITIGVAALWILLSVGAIKVLNQSQSVFGDTSRSTTSFSDNQSAPTTTTPSGTAPTGPAATTPSAPTTPAASSPAPSSPAPVATGKAEAEAPAAPVTEKK